MYMWSLLLCSYCRELSLKIGLLLRPVVFCFCFSFSFIHLSSYMQRYIVLVAHGLSFPFLVSREKRKGRSPLYSYILPFVLCLTEPRCWPQPPPPKAPRSAAAWPSSLSWPPAGPAPRGRASGPPPFPPSSWPSPPGRRQETEGARPVKKKKRASRVSAGKGPRSNSPAPRAALLCPPHHGAGGGGHAGSRRKD